MHPVHERPPLRTEFIGNVTEGKVLESGGSTLTCVRHIVVSFGQVSHSNESAGRRSGEIRISETIVTRIVFIHQDKEHSVRHSIEHIVAGSREIARVFAKSDLCQCLGRQLSFPFRQRITV